MMIYKEEGSSKGNPGSDCDPPTRGVSLSTGSPDWKATTHKACLLNESTSVAMISKAMGVGDLGNSPPEVQAAIQQMFEGYLGAVLCFAEMELQIRRVLPW